MTARIEPTTTTTTTRDPDALAARVKELEARLAAVTGERDKLRRAYELLVVEVHRLRRRIFMARAERVDAGQLELEFAHKRAELEKLSALLGLPLDSDDAADGDQGDRRKTKTKKDKAATGGRRDLRELDMPEERCEVRDPALDAHAEVIGFDESVQIGFRRASYVRFIIARAKYKTTDAEGNDVFPPPASPKELFPKTLAAPSLMAHILAAKFAYGMPFHRQEEKLAADGLPLDRGTMCRWAEHAGMSLGWIVQAALEEAKRTAFCLATDATGIAIQPEPSKSGARQACKKGHFFVTLADKDHVFFEYQPKHTSEAVSSMFRGFEGYIQADAHGVYDALFRGAPPADAGDDARTPPPIEVGCWSHARRKFFDAAATKDVVAREGLFRIRMLFENEAAWKDVAPAKRTTLRQQRTKPLMEAFFAWAEAELARVKGQRGLLATALGYAVRQRGPLSRFLEDGRLRIDNNASERALRSIAVGRKAWMFCGSHDHAEATANLFSLVASCRLHGLDPETYLTDVLRVFAAWPPARHLELAPKYWAATRARLDDNELARPVGFVTVPPAPPKE